MFLLVSEFKTVRVLLKVVRIQVQNIRIDGFHGDVIRLQSQKSEVLRILIYTRLKISRKYIFVQVSSPEACFISKIQQFEVPSFHSAWHQKRNAISLKKSLSSWFSAV